jgi:hypothetical protein
MAQLQTNIAYCAGLFEGEGNFGSEKYYVKRCGTKSPRKTPYAFIQIAMTDVEPLERIKELFPAARLTGPYSYKNYKPVYRLVLKDREQLYYAVNEMWQYLSPRRRQQWREAHELV